MCANRTRSSSRTTSTSASARPGVPAKTVETRRTLLGLSGSRAARAAVGDWLDAPQSFVALLDESVACVDGNAPLAAYLCAATDGAAPFPEFASGDVDDNARSLWRTLHKAAVVEVLTAAMIADPDMAREVSFLVEAAGEGILNFIEHESVHRDDPTKVQFMTQKWHSVNAAVRRIVETVALGRYLDGSHAASEGYSLAINILEATKVDAELPGGTMNTEVGLALARDAQIALPRVDGDRRQITPLGKDYVDAYVAWNLAYVLEFADLEYVYKLLIPSCACSDDAHHAPHGHAGLWKGRRVYSLFLMMRILTAPEPPGAAASGALKDATAARRAFGASNYAAADLFAPEACGEGSLDHLFDKLEDLARVRDDDHEANPSPTEPLSRRGFKRYTTGVMWFSTCLAGLGAEIILGPFIVAGISAGTARTLWVYAQVFFPLALTVAMFGRSVFGLPFLVFGLWKGGFPETVGYLVKAHEYVLLPRLGMSLLEALGNYLNGVGLALHHTMCCFVICGWITGLFALTRPSIAPCVVLVAQHWWIWIRYHDETVYTVLELALEVMFEWEVIAALEYYCPRYGYDRLARPAAMTMLFAHWLFLLASGCEILAPKKKAPDLRGTLQRQETWGASGKFSNLNDSDLEASKRDLDPGAP